MITFSDADLTDHSLAEAIRSSEPRGEQAEFLVVFCDSPTESQEKEL